MAVAKRGKGGELRNAKRDRGTRGSASRWSVESRGLRAKGLERTFRFNFNARPHQLCCLFHCAKIKVFSSVQFNFEVTP